jgi:Tol biopolymer transport system component
MLGFSRPSWTPDGRVVFGTALGNEGLYMTDAQFSTTLTRIDAQKLTDVNDPIVSHDGKFIAYVHAKHVWRMGIDGSNPTQIDPTDTDVDDGPPFWSPDDQTIYWSGYAGNVYFHPAADGNGLPTKIFDLIPSLKDHVLIVTSTGSLDWIR